MNILFLLLLSIWVLSFPALSVPVEVKPDPPASDPVIPTEKDPFFNNSSDLGAHSPGNFPSPHIFVAVYLKYCLVLLGNLDS